MPRTEIHRDDHSVVYEVTDDNGNVIGTDEEHIAIDATPSLEAQVAALTDAVDTLILDSLGGL